MSRREMVARDKRMAATHEAAHAIVVASFGYLGTAQIIPNPDGGLWEKTWVGKFFFEQFALSKNASAVVGVAGMIAEVLADEPDCTPDELCESWKWRDIEPSPTDMQIIRQGRLSRRVIVTKATQILRDQKALHELAVAHLIRRRVLYGHDILALALQLITRPAA